MPAQQGLWLDDEQGLVPGSNRLCQENEEDAIRFRACWPLHLPFENDELLSQEGIFRDQFGLASAKICHGLQRQGGPERFRPTSKANGERM